MFVSIGLRLKIDVEALNMVEPLGAYTRHRTVPLIKNVREQSGIRYRIVVAPAISGQSINNGYSRALVDLALNTDLPVCDECKNYPTRGGFTKRTKVDGKTLNYDRRIETCVVEDITGFLAPQDSVRKTSPVMFSNMVPDIEYGKAIVDSQFHVRYNFEAREHEPFNIEAGSAIYMLSIAVNVDDIGKLTSKYINDRVKRVELAFKGLEVLVEGLNFGAKKSRYLPIYEVLGGVAAISHPLPFMVSKPKLYYSDKSYVEDTVVRAEKYAEALKDFGESIIIVYFDREGVIKSDVKSKTVTVEKVDTYIELIENVLSKIKEKLSKGSAAESR